MSLGTSLLLLERASDRACQNRSKKRVHRASFRKWDQRTERQEAGEVLRNTEEDFPVRWLGGVSM